MVYNSYSLYNFLLWHQQLVEIKIYNVLLNKT